MVFSQNSIVGFIVQDDGKSSFDSSSLVVVALVVVPAVVDQRMSRWWVGEATDETPVDAANALVTASNRR